MGSLQKQNKSLFAFAWLSVTNNFRGGRTYANAPLKKWLILFVEAHENVKERCLFSPSAWKLQTKGIYVKQQIAKPKLRSEASANVGLYGKVYVCLQNSNAGSQRSNVEEVDSCLSNQLVEELQSQTATQRVELATAVLPVGRSNARSRPRPCYLPVEPKWLLEKDLKKCIQIHKQGLKRAAHFNRLFVATSRWLIQHPTTFEFSLTNFSCRHHTISTFINLRIKISFKKEQIFNVLLLQRVLNSSLLFRSRSDFSAISFFRHLRSFFSTCAKSFSPPNIFSNFFQYRSYNL